MASTRQYVLKINTGAGKAGKIQSIRTPLPPLLLALRIHQDTTNSGESRLRVVQTNAFFLKSLAYFTHSHPLLDSKTQRTANAVGRRGDTAHKLSSKPSQQQQYFAPKQGATPMAVPWGYFWDAKNHKRPTFSRKIRSLRFYNLAVKERFEHRTRYVDLGMT